MNCHKFAASVALSASCPCQVKAVSYLCHYFTLCMANCALCMAHMHFVWQIVSYT